MAFETDSDGVTVGIDFEGDDAQISAEFTRIARIMERSIAAVAPQIGRSFSKGIQAEFGSTFIRQAAGVKGIRDSAEQAARAFNAAGESTDNFSADITALNKRIEATKRILSDVGAQPELFAVVDVELRKLLRLQDRFERAIETGTLDAPMFRQLADQARTARVVVGKEVSSINQELRSLSAIQKTEGNRANEVLRGQNKEREAIIKADSGRFVAETQREGSLQLAADRATAARRIQAQKQFGRTRIELLRFTLNQVRVLERGIAGVFRATAAVVTGAYARIESSVFRVGRLFQRSNAELNDGLRGALITRERTIERSFGRQTNDVRQATLEQSRLLDRFDRQASRGIVGAATGRSRLGSLVGGGVGIGGGFVLLRQLREGFDESVNLNESLNKTREIFNDAAEDIVAFSETSVEALFTTQSAALEAAANFGIFGKAAGLQGQELSDFSKRLTLLATDLASFNNTSVQDATTAISAALRGESEPIRRFGVLLNEATLQQRAFSLGITDTVRKLEPFERVLAANAEIFAQTADQQGDAARTADDFANSSKRAGAAATEAFAALVRRLIPIATIITNRAFPALQNLTRFIEGDVGPAMRVFRSALVGAAAGLTALLVAKAAGEAIRFLGIALRFTLTPLGLLAAGAAAVGAAIAVFSDRSERFASSLSNITTAARALGGRALTLAGAGLSRLGELITNRVVPAARALGGALIGPVKRGLEIAFGLIFNVAIPAARRLGEFLAANLVPALERVGGVLRDDVLPVLQGFARVAVGVLAAVARFVEPAITGFVRLGEAIVGAFRTGDVSGLLDGLRAVASGIGQVFGNLGILLVRVLRPQIERAVRFIADAFNGIDFAAIGKKILEIVRLVGFVLGSIVSDPRFIQALEAIVAAAVIVGGNFVLGFVEGVASNLPELASLLGGQLKMAFSAALEFAFDNPTLIAKVLLGALAARTVMNAYTAAGEAGAKALVSGFVPMVRRRLDRDRGFAAGFFGSPAAIERQATRAANRAAKAYGREIGRNTRDIQRLGGRVEIPFSLDEDGVRRSKRQVDQLKSDFIDVGAEGILAGARSREALRGASAMAGGFATVLRGDVRGGFRLAGTGAQQFARAVSDQFVALQAQGRLSGAALGSAVLGGFGAIISGQQLGSATSGTGQLLGLSGILASAIGVGLSPAGPVVGAAVGGIGIIIAAFQRAGAAARAEAELIKEFTDQFIRLRDEASRVDFVAETITSQITSGLNRGQTELIRGLGEGGLTELSSRLVDGTVDVVEVFRKISEEAGATRGEVTAFIEAIGEDLDLSNLGILGSAFQPQLNLQDTLAAEQAYDDFAEAIGRSGAKIEDLDKVLGILVGSNDAVATSVQQATVLNDALGKSATDAANEAAEASEKRTSATRDGLDIVREAGENLLNTDLSQYWDGFDFDFDSLLTEWESFVSDAYQIGRNTFQRLSNTISDTIGNIGNAVPDFFSAATEERANRAQSAYEDFVQSLMNDSADAEESVEGVGRSVDLVGAAISELNDRRTNRVNAQIEQVRIQLDAATQAAQTARDSLTDFLTGGYSDTAQAAVDDLIGQVGSIGSEIEDAMLQGGVRGDAALRSAVGGFESSIAQIIRAGFEDGLRTQEEFRDLLAPLGAAINEEIGDSASRILSNVDFEFGITNRAGSNLAGALDQALAGRQIEANVAGVLNADAEVARIQSQLDAQQAHLDVDVQFSADQIRAALAEAGASAVQLTEVTPLAAAQAQQPALNAAVSEGRRIAEGANNTTVTQEQTNNIEITVPGSSNPQATAAAVIEAQRAATAGRPATPWYSQRLRPV